MAKNNDSSSSSDRAAKGGLTQSTIPTIRHGGKAGKDTVTQVIEDVFQGILRHRVVSIAIVVLLLVGMFGLAWLSKISTDKATEARQGFNALFDQPEPKLADIQTWLTTYPGTEDEVPARVLLIQRYMALATEHAKTEYLDQAKKEFDLLRSNFADHPVVTAQLHRVGGVEGANFLEVLEQAMEKSRKPLEADFKAPFRKPDPPVEKPAVEPVSAPEPVDEAATPNE